ncbi:MAG: hypothetical protein V4561_10235 [Bacteroidota bacterium]
MKQETSIAEFIRQTLTEINTGLPDGFVMDEVVEFEISVTTNRQTNGKLSLNLLSADTSTGNEIVQKISFSVINSTQKEINGNNENLEMIKNLSDGFNALIKIGESAQNNRTD